MNHELQPYLPGLKPGEQDPIRLGETYRGEDFSAREIHGDWHIEITPSGFEKLVKHSNVAFDYQPVSAFSTDGKGGIKVFRMILTRDASLLKNNPDCRDGIIFSREDWGMALIVKASLVGQLGMGEREFVMTRFDGTTDKIWIRMQEPVNFEKAA